MTPQIFHHASKKRHGSNSASTTPVSQRIIPIPVPPICAQGASQQHRFVIGHLHIGVRVIVRDA